MKYPEVLQKEKKDIWKYNEKISGDINDGTHCYYQVFYKNFGMHRHSDFYEISVILEGECMHYIENNRCLAGKGSVFVIPPGISHGYAPAKKIKIFNLLISENFLKRYNRELESFTGFDLLFEIEPSLRGEIDIDLFLKFEDKDFKKVRKEFEKLYSYEESAYSGRVAMKNAKALEILGIMCERISHRKAPEVTKKSDIYALTIVKSMEYIKENLSSDLSARMLSRVFNMSESTFIRHFRRVSLQTPYEYILTSRIKAAKLLLRDTKKTVVAIGKECGFYDGAHFVRCFERSEGMNPSKYREKF